MSVPSSPRNTEWQPGRIPRLSYQNPLPKDEVNNAIPTPRGGSNYTNKLDGAGSVCTAGTKSAAASTTTSAPPKKKSSFLSGLFAKEPTKAALAQVEADLKAKYGAATPQKVPHVSSQKMPEHVPKVNSKWDGVPESVRMRDKEDRKARRRSHQGSSAPTQSVRSCNSEGSAHSSRQYWSGFRRNSYAADCTEGWQIQNSALNQLSRPVSAYSTCTDNSRETYAKKDASIRSQSLSSPSGASLPEVTYFFPHHKTQPVPEMPQRWQSANSSNSHFTPSSYPSKSNSLNSDASPSAFDAIHEHSSSPVATPQERSPVTPSYQEYRAAPPANLSCEQSTSDKLQAGHHRGVNPRPLGAFLAGEAKPLELNENETEKSSNLHFRRFQSGHRARYCETT